MLSVYQFSSANTYRTKQSNEWVIVKVSNRFLCRFNAVLYTTCAAVYVYLDDVLRIWLQMRLRDTTGLVRRLTRDCQRNTNIYCEIEKCVTTVHTAKWSRDEYRDIERDGDVYSGTAASAVNREHFRR